VGSLLIVLAYAVLFFDRWWAPWYPCLALATLLFGLLASGELRDLLPEPRPPAVWLQGGVVTVLLVNWMVPIFTSWFELSQWACGLPLSLASLAAVAWTTVLLLLVGFLVEMARFRPADGATHRLAYGTLALLWLGVAPSFLVQLRWFGWTVGSDNQAAADLGLWALAFGIFVPKVGDIAAYFTGSFLGRHRLAPVLSPKKTWEGAIGGLLGSLTTGVAISWLSQRVAERLFLPWPQAVLASLVVGVVAQLSDLAESLVKRDRQVKDTSAYFPGLGGILDTIDSLLFSGPITWLMLSMLST
ncbi:MAG: phosphatidate cytidylyltransferase, partial [Gemmatales bacterium]|nr:phosphatidate cytidylyltransferase [Gemmatales bacterium]MDW8175768.1 phosphatidate cytidylyltransferase [Gemmatales bacterium]